MLTTGKKMISNTIYLFLDWSFLTVFGFLFWFIIGKTLLPEQYGIIATSINIMMLVSSITFFGMSGPITKLIPEYLKKNNIRKVKSLIKFSLKIILTLNVFFLILTILLSSQISFYTKLPREAVIISAIGILFSSFYNFSTHILYGFQNMKKIFETDAIGSILKVIITFLLIFLGLNYIGPLLAYLLSIFIIFLIRFDRTLLKKDSVEIDKKSIIHEYAIPMFIITIASVLFTNGQYIILSTLTNPQITGLFAVAFLLTTPLFVIPNLMSVALFPITSQLSVNNEIDRQKYFISLVFRYVLFITLPLATFLTFFSDAIILIFSRYEYISASTLILPLSLAAITNGFSTIFLSSLYAMKKPKIHRNIIVFSSTLFILISLLLVRAISSLGMALAYLISMTVAMILGYAYLKKLTNFTLPMRQIVKIIISMIPFLILIQISDALELNIYIKLVTVLIGALSYVTTLAKMKFYIKEDARIIDFVATRSPIFKKELKIIRNFVFNHIKE